MKTVLLAVAFIAISLSAFAWPIAPLVDQLEGKYGSQNPDDWPMVLHWPYVLAPGDTTTLSTPLANLDFPNKQECVRVAIEMQLSGIKAWCDWMHYRPEQRQ
jgi:hypothetical protein